MKVSFAYDKATSPVSKIASSSITSYPPEQYMALCQFTNIFWEYDREHNFAPVLVFEGEIERLDAIDKKFPHDIDSVYFTKNKPHIRYDYSFNDDQYATLASKGFWSGDGVHIPEIFTTSKFQLECFASVDEVTNAYEKQNVPILNIQVDHPYENTFAIEQYDISDFITREQPEESKNLENKTYEANTFETNIEAEVEAAKAAAIALAQQAQQTEYKPLTEAELDIKRKSSNVSSYVDEVRERLYGKRAEHNEAVDAEKARLAAEQAARDGTAPAPEKDKDIVEFDDTPISKASANEKLVEADETNKFESNDAIFNSPADAEEEKVPENIAAFMQRLGIGSETAEAGNQNSADSKNGSNSDSGAASGAQGLGVYTFEDQSTAQFEMRQDEGVGNEKPNGDKKSDEKPDNKNDSGSGSNSDSGAASGAQGLGTYTFEDQSTAQFEMRQDEGAGNEKPSDDKDDKKSDEKQDNKNDNKAAVDDKSSVNKSRREAQLASAIQDTTVMTESVSDERTK